MRRIAVILIGAIFFCCGDDDPTGPEPGGEFYPLAIGNSWVYLQEQFDTLGNVELGDTITVIVERDTLIEGETWYVTDVTEGATFDFGYCISQSDGFWTNWPNEQLYYKYPAHVGDQFTVAGYPVTVEDLADPVTVPAGQFDCVRYKLEAALYSFASTDWVSRNIGLIKSETSIERPNGEEYIALRIRLLSYSLE